MSSAGITNTKHLLTNNKQFNTSLVYTWTSVHKLHDKTTQTSPYTSSTQLPIVHCSLPLRRETYSSASVVHRSSTSAIRRTLPVPYWTQHNIYCQHRPLNTYSTLLVLPHCTITMYNWRKQFSRLARATNTKQQRTNYCWHPWRLTKNQRGCDVHHRTDKYCSRRIEISEF